MKYLNKRNIVTFSIVFGITCLIFLPLLVGHYATDTYNIANIGNKHYATYWSLLDGRIFMAIIGTLADLVHMPIEVYVFLTLFFALIVSNISVVVLSNIIKKYKKPENFIQEATIVAISYITIFNFMYIEDMYFVESIAMAISVLLFLISADILVDKNKKYIIKSFILTTLGVTFYQGTIGLFIVYTILFTIMKNKNNIKQIVIDIIKCGIIAGVGILIDIAFVKVVEHILNKNQKRLGSISKIFDNIIQIIVSMPQILQNTCNLFPKNLFIIFLGILTTIIIIYGIINRKDKGYIIIKYLNITILCILASNITYVLSLTSFYTGRLRNALGALIGIIFIFIYVETSIFNKKGVMQVITYITLITFVLINSINYQSIILQHKKVNKMEKEQVLELEEYIKEHEETNNTKVTQLVKVAILNNQYKAYFPNSINKTPFTHNALRTEWAVQGVINMYAKRKLKQIKATKEEVENYINNCDLEKEYKCIGDTLYVNIYAY